ncbi:methyltransferase domain-containing protein [Uniformispora flossi]|uniref:methyltransferase domain-containing protein n=1 Tax=Uniformispora flossi TaxID=3390723 RepID=UPI003C2F6D8F
MADATTARPVRSHPVFAVFYRRLCDVTDRAGFAEVRAALLAEATGKVLEIGAGTGGNLPHYVNADRLSVVEPDPAMLKVLRTRLDRAPVPVELMPAPAERIPYADGQFDTVVFTLVLCSVADLDKAVAEAKRVLKPGGKVLFIEHVGAPSAKARRTQQRIEPVWKRLFGGCLLTRDPVAAFERAGFADVAAEDVVLGRNPAPAKPIIRGSARA